MVMLISSAARHQNCCYQGCASPALEGVHLGYMQLRVKLREKHEK